MHSPPYAFRSVSEKDGQRYVASVVAYFGRLGRELRSETQVYSNGNARTVLADTAYRSDGTLLRTSQPYFPGGDEGDIYWTTTGFDHAFRPVTVSQRTEDHGTIVTSGKIGPVRRGSS